jgi:hypothetical protein
MTKRELFEIKLPEVGFTEPFSNNLTSTVSATQLAG